MRRQTRVFALETPIGWIGIEYFDELIHSLKLGVPDRNELVALFPQMENRSTPGRFTDRLQERLERYFSGCRVDFDDFDILDRKMTDFQKSVTRACRQIDYGETISYSHLAKRVGSPKAARAVGTVMKRNPFPLIVPCHRVIGANSALGGFSAGSGTNTKRRLLELEGTLLF